MIEFQNYFVWI